MDIIQIKYVFLIGPLLKSPILAIITQFLLMISKGGPADKTRILYFKQILT